MRARTHAECFCSALDSESEELVTKALAALSVRLRLYVVFN